MFEGKYSKLLTGLLIAGIVAIIGGLIFLGIIVAKNNFGPSGTVNLLFNKRITKFLNPIKVNWEF